METTEKKNAILATYATEINAAQQTIAESNRIAVEKGREAFQSVLRAGEYLAKAKDLCAKGDWAPWLTANCPNISEQTAMNYRKVYSWSIKHEGIFDEIEGIREAYLLMGIVKAKSPKAKVETTEETGADEVDNVAGEPPVQVGDKQPAQPTTTATPTDTPTPTGDAPDAKPEDEATINNNIDYNGTDGVQEAGITALDKDGDLATFTGETWYDALELAVDEGTNITVEDMVKILMARATPEQVKPLVDWYNQRTQPIEINPPAKKRTRKAKATATEAAPVAATPVEPAVAPTVA